MNTLPCLWASSGIFFTLQSAQFHPTWFTWGTRLQWAAGTHQETLWQRTSSFMGNNKETQQSTTEKPVVSTYHAQEWKDCGSDPRKGSAMSNRRAALLCLMLLFAFCAALQSILSPVMTAQVQTASLHPGYRSALPSQVWQTSFTPLSSCEMRHSSPAPVPSWLQLAIKKEGSTQKQSQQFGWKVLATANVKCLLLPIRKLEIH